METYKIEERTFVNTLYLCVGKQEDYAKWVKRKFKHKHKLLEDFDGLHLAIEGNDIIWLEEFKNTPEHIGVLAHELLHLVAGEFKYREIPLTEETGEVYAYLIRFYMTECLKRLNNKT